jgi:hypothetical protein
VDKVRKIIIPGPNEAESYNGLKVFLTLFSSYLCPCTAMTAVMKTLLLFFKSSGCCCRQIVVGKEAESRELRFNRIIQGRVAVASIKG